jgi:hypothetical protein
MNITCKSAWPAKNAGRQRGELRKQGFSAVQRNVKTVVFQEAGRAYFWLVFFDYFF